MSKDQENVCGDCNYCFPDKKGPTSFGVCLLDPELKPFEEEIPELNFENCKELVKKKRFDINHKACPYFSPAEIEDLGELDELDEAGLPDLEAGNAEAKYVRLDQETTDMEAYFSQVPVEGYLNKLYSSDPEKSREALTSLGGLKCMKNKAAETALLDFFKSLDPPQSLKEVKFKREVFGYLRDLTDHPDVLQVLLSDLEKTKSNNTTRQWLTAILDGLRLAPPDQIQDALSDMLKRKLFSHRFKKRIEDLLEDLQRY